MEASNSIRASFQFNLIHNFHKLLNSAGFHWLNEVKKKVSYIAEPAGDLRVHQVNESSQSHNCHPITVVSANLWHDWPRYRNLEDRLESFARQISQLDADVLLVQEVARTTQLQVDEWLAKRLHMQAVYARVNGHLNGIGFEEGLAVLTRFPILDMHLRKLGTGKNPFVRRLALGTIIDSPCGPFLAVSVHMGLTRAQNAIQIHDLQTWVKTVAAELPALIGGDFNAGENSPQIKKVRRSWLDTFRSLHPDKDGTTHEIRFPWGGKLHRARLDYIFIDSNHLCF